MFGVLAHPSAPRLCSALALRGRPMCALPPPMSALTSPALPFTLAGNLLKVTEGEHAGKLCLLDFGLVAEVPPADREAMVSATIHLANRDWPALIDDFVALEFLPADCDRGVIIPVMDRVLSPYLRGGGAKSFNFQVRGPEVVAVGGSGSELGRGRWRWARSTGRVGGGRAAGLLCVSPPGADPGARAWSASLEGCATVPGVSPASVRRKARRSAPPT